MNNNRLIPFLLLFFIFQISTLLGQDLFEEAVKESTADNTESSKNKSFKLNGFIRGDYFAGKKADISEGETKSGYGEVSLKPFIKKDEYGNAFAEIRVKKGMEFSRDVQQIDLREAYINLYLGHFDFKIGQQIVVWGRADGFNPTNNITPQNMFVRSYDLDDRRESNFLFRSYYNAEPFRLEGIWIPFYRPSVLPTEWIPFPNNIKLSKRGDYPEPNLDNSGFALKPQLDFASFDASVSYYNGPLPFSGLTGKISSYKTIPPKITVIPKSYRMHIAGGDFSTTIAGYMGVRGEAAYREPVNQDYKKEPNIPNPDIQYVLGLDKEIIRDVTFLVQYIGRYVTDFDEQKNQGNTFNPVKILKYKLSRKNRMIFGQQNKISHAASLRIDWMLLNDTLTLELNLFRNFTTEEIFIRPAAGYDIYDALSLYIGAEYYNGKRGTLYDLATDHLSAGFVELKIWF
jgi:hypothetical protein